MVTYRCKCGEHVWHSSMGFAPCEGCEICNTTPAAHPDNHTEPIPHEWELEYSRKTGKPENYICKNCFKTKPYEDAQS